MLVDSQGTVDSENGATLGEFNGSNGGVQLQGAGTVWLARKALTVGNVGRGVLSVLDGARLTTIGSDGPNVIGSSRHAGVVLTTSTVTVASSGVWASSGPIIVGRGGSGRLNIEEGLVESAGANAIGVGTTGTDGMTAGEGYVSLKDGVWTISGGLNVGRADGQAQATIELEGTSEISATNEILLQMNNVTVKGEGTITTTKMSSKGVGAHIIPRKPNDEIATLNFNTPEFDAADGMTLFADLRKVDGVVDNDVLVVTGSVAFWARRVYWMLRSSSRPRISCRGF